MARNVTRKRIITKAIFTLVAIFIGIVLAVIVVKPLNAAAPNQVPDVPIELANPDDPAKWELPSTAVENVNKRTRDSKEFSNANGSLTSILSPNLHYEETPGVWQNSDTSFVFDGTDAVMEKHPMYNSRVSNEGISLLTTDTGKGITWLTSHRPSIHFNYVDGQFRGETASFIHDGLVWTEKNTNYGVKASAMVTAPRGTQTYSFGYSLEGGANALTVDSDGNIIGDGFTVPRSIIIGANRVRYEATPWVLNAGFAEFTFDDTLLPAEAYPYEVDPTTTTLQRGNTTVNDNFLVSNHPTLNFDGAIYLLWGDQTGIANTATRSLIYFDTSTIPAAATVTAATFSAYMYGGGSDVAGTSVTKMQRLLRNWVDAETTWNIYSTGNSWTTAGASSDGNDRVAATSASMSYTNSSGASNAYQDWTGSTLTSDVQNFVDGSYSNYGWLLTCDCEYQGASNYSFQEYRGSDYGYQSYRPKLVVTYTQPSAAITGTIGDGATEQEVRDGNGTILVTLTDDTWVADGATFNAQRQNIIDGLDAASSPTNGWNNEVRDKISVGSVVRSSATLATITLTASEVADYSITSNEIITVTVPATALTAAGALTATPTITITSSTESAAVTGTIGDGATEQEVRDGDGTILVTLTNTKWVADGATFNAQRQNIIDGLDAADAQAAGWNAQVRDQLGVTSVVRTSDTLATITIAAADVAGYAIATNETITVTVPATAIVYGTALTATPTITITAGTESAAITGTISDGATSPQIKAGGQTAIVTLTNTKWVADGATFNAQRQNIIDGFVSASSETDGWNNSRSDFAVTDVVRTSDIIATVEFSASSDYTTSAAETITLTVPATAIGGTALTATPTFVITPNFVSSGTWVSPAINLSSIIDTAYCALGWSENIPAGTSAAVEYSSNGGSSYSTATNGSCPFSIGGTLAAVSDFRIRVSLTTTDVTLTPTITALGFIAGTTAGQTVRYQLNTTPALTATDRTGNGYSGTMSFPTLPSGVSTTVGSMTALRAPPSAQTARGIPQVTSPVTGTAVSDNIFNTNETGWTGLPGYQLVNTMATAGEGGGGGLPVQFIWYIMLGLVTIMLGFFALNLTQSLFAAGVAMALGLGASIAMGGGLIPGWVIFVFIPVAIGMIFLRPRLAI